jgi:hypothetical protein
MGKAQKHSRSVQEISPLSHHMIAMAVFEPELVKKRQTILADNLVPKIQNN